MVDMNNKTTPSLQERIILLPCPFCGGEVQEVQPSWNIANAECKQCSYEWGHCGAQFDGRYDKWNSRDDTALQSEQAKNKQLVDGYHAYHNDLVAGIANNLVFRDMISNDGNIYRIIMKHRI